MERTGRPVSRAAAVRALDAALINGVGIPSPVLMEHAAHGVADAIVAWWPRATPPRTLVLCGPGNNGGDGYAVARHLALRGWPVRCVAVAPPRSPECVTMHHVAERLGLVGPEPAPELVLDAVLGTGQRPPLELPPLPELHGAPVVAIDVPTGIDADTGARVGAFPAAAFVVTIGRLKPFCFTSAVPFALVDIGLEWKGTPPEAIHVATRPWLPPMPADANKWRRGHVAVRAGSLEKAGAAVLACHGALRGGAGLVTLLIEREAWPRLGALPPEVMVAEPGAAPAYDALVVGPGLGRAADAEVRRLWEEVDAPAVFDADGLRALVSPRASKRPRLITPHAGEAAALLGDDWRTLEGDRLATTRRLGAIGAVIYKGACPVISGEPLAILSGANPTLGTGGSGDVLAGLCGALLANHAHGRGSTPWGRAEVEAVALGAAWLHQEAARGLPVGATAREIADRVPMIRAASSAS